MREAKKKIEMHWKEGKIQYWKMCKGDQVEDLLRRKNVMIKIDE